MKVIKTGNITVELTWEECKALVKVLGPLTGELSQQTYSIYDQLDDLVGGDDE